VALAEAVGLMAPESETVRTVMVAKAQTRVIFMCFSL
jgi:hypothetical protein